MVIHYKMLTDRNLLSATNVKKASQLKPMRISATPEWRRNVKNTKKVRNELDHYYSSR